MWILCANMIIFRANEYILALLVIVSHKKIAYFLVMKSKRCSYVWIGNHVRVKKLGSGPGVGKCPTPGLYIRDLKQPRRRAKWTPTRSILTKPATSAHVSDVVHMAFRAGLFEAGLR